MANLGAKAVAARTAASAGATTLGFVGLGITSTVAAPIAVGVAVAGAVGAFWSWLSD